VLPDAPGLRGTPVRGRFLNMINAPGPPPMSSDPSRARTHESPVMRNRPEEFFPAARTVPTIN
jgi:hypothetical protein